MITFQFDVMSRSKEILSCVLLVALVLTSRVYAADEVTVREVDVWSEGTRMAGDLYSPAGVAPVGGFPAVVLSHGWGGTKAGLKDYATRFANEGYIALAFDYRGWGESDGRLVVHGEMPKADSSGKVHVEAERIQTVVDPYDQVVDITHAISYVLGESNVDPKRIGYWGSSYSGGHAVWVAVNEPRVACVVGQVAAADSLDLAKTSWKGIDIEALAAERRLARARGEVSPVPQGTDKAPNLRGWAVLEKVITYRPVEDAGKIIIPIFMIDAEKEELFDRHKAGELAIERAKANGAPTKYHVVMGITHYGIYSGKPKADALDMAVEWYDEHLKK